MQMAPACDEQTYQIHLHMRQSTVSETAKSTVDNIRRCCSPQPEGTRAGFSGKGTTALRLTVDLPDVHAYLLERLLQQQWIQACIQLFTCMCVRICVRVRVRARKHRRERAYIT